MRESHLNLLACPECGGDLSLSGVTSVNGESIESGDLTCRECESCFPIIGHIPRFVPMDNYARGFGFQWAKHAKTQCDSYTGLNASERRFFEETKWPRDLTGETLLEVGGGAGRFTEQAASTGATVASLDYSRAVEANYASNGHRGNVLIVQGNIYRMPFKKSSFDRLFCFGVLQHTPDVERAFASLPLFIKSGGRLAVDVYRKYPLVRQLLKTKYWVRPLTKRLHPARLYRIVDRYVNLMWPLAKLIHKLPFGRKINWTLLVADYLGDLEGDDDLLKDWAKLDTFDMLSPAYDQPQDIETVRRWFRECGLTGAEVHYGYNGIEGRGIRP